MHTKMGKWVVNKNGICYPRKSTCSTTAKKRKIGRRNDLSPSSSNTLNDICDEQRVMNSNINNLIEMMERRNLISPMVSSKDDDD